MMNVVSRHIKPIASLLVHLFALPKAFSPHDRRLGLIFDTGRRMHLPTNPNFGQYTLCSM